MTTTAPPQDLIGLPPDTTLLDFGKWLLDPKNQRDVDAYLGWVQSQGAEVGSRILQTVYAAVELAKTSTTAGSYLRDPVGWIEKYVEFPKGDGLADYQAEALSLLGSNGRLALRGPRGLGKSAIGSLAVLWFAMTREASGIDWKIATTASAGRQLKHFLWPEIHKWSRCLRWELLGRGPFTPNEMLDLRLKLDHGDAWAQAAHDPNTIEGAHATHLFYLYDESKSVAKAMWDSAEGAFANAGPDTGDDAWFLALSVPGPPSGRFYEIHSRKRGLEKWAVIHVKKEQAIAAGRMSATWPDEMQALWGQDSALYQQHVEGNFASSASNAVIPLEWVEAAVERWHSMREARANIGVLISSGLDIAREGEDETVFAMTFRDYVPELVRPGSLLTGPLVARIRVELARYPGRPGIVVDAEGVGAGVYDGLATGVDWQDRVFPFIAAASPHWYDYTRTLTMHNLRSAGWWSLRDELDPNRADGHVPTLALPPDEMLIGDLTTPTYNADSGKILIEKKKEIRKRLGRSTDSGDAVVQARFGIQWVAKAAITAASHRSPASSGDLRRQPDAAGPDHGAWNPLTVQF